MKLFNRRKWRSVMGSLVVVASYDVAAQAQTWIAPGDGIWSAGANWDTTLPPVSDPSTHLTFNASGATSYTATNDLGAFTLNSLSVNNAGTGTVSIASGTLTFGGTAPALSLAGTGSASITSPITFGAGTQVTNSSTGTLTLTNETFGNNVTITNSSTGTVTLTDGATFAGSNVTINLANSGGGTFNIGNMGPVSGMLNITTGAVTFAGSPAGDLFGNSLILNIAAGASFNFANNAEGFGGISGAGNIILGTAGISFVEAGDRTYTGVISGTGGVGQAVANVLTLGGANTYTGTTTVSVGGTIRAAAVNTLSAGSIVSLVTAGKLDLNGFNQTVAGLTGDATGVVTLGTGTLTLSPTAARVYSGGISGSGNLVIAGTAAGTESLLGATTYTGTTTVTSGTLKTLASNSSAGAGVSIASGATLDLLVSTDTSLVAPLSGSGTLINDGPGKITIGTANPSANLTVNLRGGSLVLDDTSDNNLKLGASATALIADQSLTLLGNSSAASSQTLNGVTLQGAAKIQVTSGNNQNATLALGPITRSAGSGSTVNFSLNNTGTGVASLTTTNGNNTNGILGGYATVGNTDWAVAGTAGTATSITALAAANYSANTWAAGKHTDVTSSFAAASGIGTSDVRFNTPVAATVTLAGSNQVSSGGILVTPNVGANLSTITGGTALSVPANQDLIVNQFNTAGGLTIASVINNTPGTALTQTATSIATTGNTQTITVGSTAGLSIGMLVTGTGVAIATNAHVIAIPSPTTVTLAYAAPLTAGTNVSLTFTPETNVVKSGAGLLTLSATNTFAGTIAVNEGTLKIGAIGTAGASAASGAGTSSIVFNGGTVEFGTGYSAGTGLQPWLVSPLGGTIQVDSGFTANRTGNGLFGTGPLLKTGAGTWSLGSNGSNYSGAITVNAGVVSYTSSDLASVSGFTVNPGGQYQINDNGTGNWNFASGVVLNLSGDGPAGSSTPGAMALTVQSTGPGPVSTFTNAISLTTTSRIGSYISGANVPSLILFGQITGPGGLVKDGGGLLTLSNATNAYAGNTTISNGTLRGGVANALPTTTILQFGELSSTNAGIYDLNGFNQSLAGLVTVGGSGHQIINAAASAASILTINYSGTTPETFDGQIGGGTIATPANNNITLVKSGTGTLTLTAADTYSGKTTISAGTLRVASSGVPGLYTVADGAGLIVTNNAPAVPYSMSTLTIGATKTTNLGFEFNGSGVPTAGGIAVATAGGLTLNGTINVSVSSVQPLPIAEFPLITYTGSLGGTGFAAFNPTVTLPSRVLGSLVNNTANSSIDLNVTGVDTIKWNGVAGNAWDVNTTQNFKLNSNGSATTYLESPAPGDTVTFDETAAGSKTVDLSTTLQPSAVTVSGPADYTFTSSVGTGKLAGQTGLTKTGTGALTILTNNTNTGQTTISGGTLQIGNGGTTGALGTGAVVDNAALAFNHSDDITFSSTLTGSGTLLKSGTDTVTLTGSLGITGDTTIAGGTLVVNGGGIYGGNFTGPGALVKGGVGTLAVTGNANHTGGTTVTGGTLQIGNAGTTGSLGSDVSLAAGSTLSFNRTDSLAYAGAITGAGNVTVASGTVKLTGNLNYTGLTAVGANTLEYGSATDTTLSNKITVSDGGTVIKSGAGQLTLLNADTGFVGTLVVNGGNVLLADLGASGDLNAKQITINNTGRFIFGQGGIAGENPDLPDTTFITVNTGGTFEIRVGEQWGATSLQGGTFLINGAVGSTFAAVAGATSPYVGFDLQSGTISAINTATGTGSITSNAAGGGLNKSTSGTVNVIGAVSVASLTPINISEGVLAFQPANIPGVGTAPITLGSISGAATNTTGILRMTGPGAASIARPFSVPTSGAIDVDDAGGTLTVNSSFDGAGNLNKTGPGTLAINPSLNHLTGLTSVSGGTLLLVPGTATGNYSVGNGATLATSSGAGGSSVTLPALSLGTTSSTLSFLLNTATAPTAPLLVISNADGLALNGGTHNISVTNTQPLPTGQFTLIQYNGVALNSGFTLLPLPGRTVANLLYATAAGTNSVNLNVSGTDSTLWNGKPGTPAGAAADWDLGTSANVGGTNNFKLASNGAATNFIAGDNVAFDDTAANGTTVNLTAAVNPTSVLVNNSNVNYTFQGSGSITGSTGLTKQGTGNLVVTTDNTYTGTTAVLGGTLQLGNGGATGSVLNSTSSKIVIAQAGTLVVNRSSDWSFDGVLAGNSTNDQGTIIKNGAGTWTLGGSSPFTGAMIVNAGTVLLDDNGHGGDLNSNSVVVNNGGTFIFGEHGNVDFPDQTIVTVNTGGLFDLKQGENYGGIVLTGGTYQMSGTTKTGVNTVAVAPVGYDLQSGVITTNFTGQAAGGQLGGSTELDKSTPGTVTLTGSITFAPGLTLNLKDGTLAMAAANFPVDGTAPISFGDANTTGRLQITDGGATSAVRPVTLNPGGGVIDLPTAGAAITFTGIISGSGPLTQTGAGTIKLTAANTFTGPVTVSGGTFDIEPVAANPAASSLPAGATIKNNAALVVNAPQTTATVTGTGVTNIGATGSLTSANFNQSALVNQGVATINGNGVVGAVTGVGTLNVGDGVAAAGTVTAVSLSQGTLNVKGSNVLQITANATSHVASNIGGLSIDPAAQININNNDLVIDSTKIPVATVQGYLASGYNGGAYTGPGITSSTAASSPATARIGVALADGNDPAIAALGIVAANHMLVRPTLNGDTLFRGKVDGQDYLNLRANFGTSGPTSWTKGDFNYDNAVDGADYLLLRANFGQSATVNPTIGNVTTAKSDGTTAGQPQAAALRVGSSLNALTSGSASSAQEVAPAAAPQGVLTAFVNTATGDIKIQAVGGSVSFVLYQINSAHGDLNSLPPGRGVTTPAWNTYANQSTTDFSFAAQWQQLSASNDHSVISENTASGQTEMFASGVTKDLAFANQVLFTGGLGGVGDLTFHYGLQNSDGTTTFTAGNVVYTGVPEPTAMGLVGLSIAGLLSRRRRKVQPVA